MAVVEHARPYRQLHCAGHVRANVSIAFMLPLVEPEQMHRGESLCCCDSAIRQMGQEPQDQIERNPAKTIRSTLS